MFKKFLSVEIKFSPTGMLFVIYVLFVFKFIKHISSIYLNDIQKQYIQDSNIYITPTSTTIQIKKNKK